MNKNKTKNWKRNDRAKNTEGNDFFEVTRENWITGNITKYSFYKRIHLLS